MQYINVKRKHLIFVLSAPSGAGKTSLCNEILSLHKDLCHSISYTTRSPRLGEKDGKDYRFVSKSVFQNMVKDGQFVEWAIVHEHYYGTSWKDLDAILSKGDVLLDIDVQGAKTLRTVFPDAVFIFVVPPSLDVLRERLIARGTDTDEEIRKRLERAKEEIREYRHYNYVIKNEVFGDTVKLLNSIITAERCKTRCLEVIVE